LRSVWTKKTKEKSEEEKEVNSNKGQIHEYLPFFFGKLTGRLIVKAKIDADLCIGCALCVQTCPEVFKMEGDKAVVSVSVVPADVEGTCRQAADECPVTAIIIE